MGEILRIIVQMLQQAGEVLHLAVVTVVAWWNSLPQNHALVFIISVVLILAMDQLYKTTKTEFVQTPEPNDLPRIRVVLSNVFITLVIGVIVLVLTYLVFRKPPEEAIREGFFVSLILMVRSIANLLCELLPSNQFFNILGRIVVLGGSAVLMIQQISELLL
jgi:multisubunit Na+/H+ antiporter MnhB subunit